MTRFKFLGSVSAAALMMSVGAAQASGPETSRPPASFNWTGFYAGVNAGYGWGGNTGGGYSSFTDVGIGGLAGFMNNGGNVLPDLSPRGFLGGVQAGYNFQLAPSVVAGIVADIQVADLDDSGSVTVTRGAFRDIKESKTVSTDWFGTLRAKLGLTLSNNVLLYGTGGLAYGRVKLNTSFDDPSFGGGALVFAGSESKTNKGWAYGGGLDFAVTSNWIVGLEYLHIDLGELTVVERRISGPANASTFTSTSKFSDDIVRLTVNTKF